MTQGSQGREAAPADPEEIQRISRRRCGGWVQAFANAEGHSFVFLDSNHVHRGENIQASLTFCLLAWLHEHSSLVSFRAFLQRDRKVHQICASDLFHLLRLWKRNTRDE